MKRLFRSIGLCLAITASACGSTNSAGHDAEDATGSDAMNANDSGTEVYDGGHSMLDSSAAPDTGSATDDVMNPAVDALLPPVDASSNSPAGMGPYSVTRSTPTVTGATVVVFDPTLPAGQRAPIVLFKHGFQLSTANYATTLTQIASHGYVVIGVDSAGSLFGGPTQVQERDGVIAALNWAVGSSAPFASHADAAHIAAMGHSRGGKIAVMVAAADARITALLGLDPVNGCGPGQSYGVDCPDVTMGSFAPALTMPIGLMGETADASGGFMPCAPAAQNYATIYRAIMPSTWAASWTFTDAAHMTFTDDGGGLAGSFCAAATGDVVGIRDSIRTLAVAFLDRHLQGDTSRDPYLVGASVPSDVTLEHH